jgi:outer membrane protein
MKASRLENAFRLLRGLRVLLMLIPALSLPGLDITVEQAVRMAEDSGDSVLAGETEVRKARDALLEAKAKMMPSLSLEASGSWMSHPPEGITVAAGELNPLPPIPSVDTVFVEDSEPTYFTLSLIFHQPVFTSLKLASAAQMAELGVDVARYRLSASKRTVRRGAAQAYFSALLASRSLEELAVSRSVVQEILTDTEDSFEEGVVNYQSVLEVKKNLAQAETRLISAGQSLTTSLAALRYYTGIDTEGLRLVSPFRDEAPSVGLEELQREAAENSLDREILMAGAAAAEKNLALQRGGGLLRPDFSLLVQMDVEGGHIPFSEQDWDRSWKGNLRVTLGAKLPIFDSLESHWRIEAASEEIEAALIGLRQFDKALDLEAARAHQELLESYYLLLEKRASLELAAEAYKNALVSYENEIITRREEREARLLLAASRLEMLTASHRYSLATVQVDYLRGYPE